MQYLVTNLGHEPNTQPRSLLNQCSQHTLRQKAKKSKAENWKKQQNWDIYCQEACLGQCYRVCQQISRWGRKGTYQRATARTQTISQIQESYMVSNRWAIRLETAVDNVRAYGSTNFPGLRAEIGHRSKKSTSTFRLFEAKVGKARSKTNTNDSRDPCLRSKTANWFEALEGIS